MTCLAESQPNGLFVITPVSLSLNNKYLKFRLTLQRTIFGADIVGALVPHTIRQVESIFVGHNEQGKKCIQVKVY